MARRRRRAALLLGGVRLFLRSLWRRQAREGLPVYDERVRHVTFHSPALGIKKHYYIYLPRQQRRLPAVYLLRGHEREWINKAEDVSRGNQNAIDVYEDLLARGHIGPLILVMPGLSSSDNTLSGVATNFRAPRLARKQPGIGSGQFERYFVEDLLAHVERHFHADPRRRAIDGFSLGGLMSIKLAAQYPWLFCSAGAYDGSFLYAAADGQGVREQDVVLQNPMFDAVWGKPRALRYVAANSPAHLLLRGRRRQLRAVQWLISSGPESAEPDDSNYYRAQHLIGILARRGLPNRHPTPVRADGHHCWHSADQHLRESLPLHYQQFMSR